MSLDISVGVPSIEYVYEANITHNVIPMWSKAGVYEALYESHDKRAGDYIEALRAGVADMRAKPDEYRALNASNGWGTYEGSLKFLEKTLAAFEENPDGVIHVSR